MPAFSSKPVVLRSDLIQSFVVAEGVFDLGGKLSPGSVRDQIIRSRLFFAQLLKNGYLKEGQKVGIIGAGVAGVCLAIEASRCENLKVWLIDKKLKPLSLLAGASHRIISPTLYDWPADQYESRQYEGFLPYSEASADLVTRSWHREFQSARQRGLTWVSSVEATDLHLNETGPPWRVDFTPTPDVFVPQEFDILFLCRGFGCERAIPLSNGTTHDVVKPAPFWEVDLLPTAARPKVQTWGDLSKSDRDCPVAILGGADGAIQELLRLITDGGDARQILDQIEPFIRPSATRELARLAALVENQLRFEVFSEQSVELGDAVDAAIKQLIDTIWSDDFARAVAKLLRLTAVRMYYREAKLGPCFALNQFLALVFQRCIKNLEGWDIFAPGHHVKSVFCAHPDTSEHFNQKHTIHFNPGRKWQQIDSRIMIPRLGIDPATVTCQRHLGRNHALPYWLQDWKPIYMDREEVAPERVLRLHPILRLHPKG